VSGFSRSSDFPALRGRVFLALRGWCALAAIGCCLLAGQVCAQRQLPQDAKYIKQAQFNYPFVKLGKQILRLAVGGKIYNEQNLIIMPNTAPGTADVFYRVDFNGEISQIWILTSEESKAAAEAAKKATK
jgi:hypothetical protein